MADVPQEQQPIDPFIEVTKQLRNDFESMFRSTGEHDVEAFDYPKGEKPRIQFEIARDSNEQGKLVRIGAHVDQGIDGLQKRVFRTRFGNLPEKFVDQHGETRIIVVDYELSETGEAVKKTNVLSQGKKEDSVLERFEIPDLLVGQALNFATKPDPNDFEQLRSYVTLFKEGQLTRIEQLPTPNT